MPSWNELVTSIRSGAETYDGVRKQYLRELATHTRRNVIIYYSGWLQKGEFQRQGIQEFGVEDLDKNGFMAAIHKLDKSIGLDLIIHTPGGGIAATESIVDYLRAIFGTNIRAIVPQLAMSAGTMMALACKEIFMGKHSSIGPIDPQYGGLPAHGIIEEFEQAAKEIEVNPARVVLWQPIIAKYHPTLIGECDKAIKWSDEMVGKWLKSGMFNGEADAALKAEKIVRELGTHALTKQHNRHISMETAAAYGIKVLPLENDPKLQDLVLTVHHAAMITFADTMATKIIENQNGVSSVQSISGFLQPRPAGPAASA